MASTTTVVQCTARAGAIVDADSFVSTTLELVETIQRAVNAGKSLLKGNKETILLACEELIEAIGTMKTIQRPAEIDEDIVRQLSFHISSSMDSMCSAHNETMNEVHAENAQISTKVEKLVSQNERLEDLVRLSGNMLSATLKSQSDPKTAVRSITDELKDSIREIVRDELRTSQDRTELQSIKESLNALTQKIESQPQTSLPPVAPLPMSYASATSKPVPTPITKPAIIVSAMDITKKPQDVVQEWKKAISFRQHKYAPTRIQSIPNAKLRVEFERPEQCEETIERTLTTKDFAAEKAKRRPPLVVLKGVPKEVTRDELLEVLQNQNEVKISRLCFLTANRNTALYNAVLEVSPEMRRTILALGKLNVDHSRVHVEDFSRFVQCHRCLQYGHTKAKCTVEKKPCSHCASEGHQLPECPLKSDPLKKTCYNCSKFHARMNTQGNVAHSATDQKECPRIRAMIERLQNQTDFGPA